MTEDGGGDNSIDRNTKKVRFKDLDSNSNSDMAVDSTPTSGMSRIDKVLGRGISGSGCDEDFDFLEWDIMRTNVNGIPAINFSERIQQIVVRDMTTTVVVKLLGRNLSYTLLQNRIHNLWKPSQ